VVTSARAKTFHIYGVPLLLIVAGLTIIPTLINTFPDERRDFSAFLMSARVLRQGLDPYYDPIAFTPLNTNPPAFIIATLPLTFMPGGVAFGLWTAASILGLLISLALTARALKLPFQHLLIVALGLQGVSASLRFGQVTLLLLPLMTLAWVADRHGRPVTAGGWLGALIYAKPFVGVYAIYMLWRREWRACRAMVVIYVALSAIGLLAGMRVTLSWIQTLRGLSEKTTHIVNASWPGLAARLFSVDISQPDPAYTPFLVAPEIASVVSIGGALAIALASAWAIQRQKSRDAHWAILAASMLLMSPLGWMYYIPLLIPPMAATIPALSRFVPIVVAGAMLWVPSSVLARNHFGPVATATIGSPYAWGLLVLWATLCLERDRIGTASRPSPTASASIDQLEKLHVWPSRSPQPD
jgi:hypothetical protein